MVARISAAGAIAGVAYLGEWAAIYRLSLHDAKLVRLLKKRSFRLRFFMDVSSQAFTGFHRIFDPMGRYLLTHCLNRPHPLLPGQALRVDSEVS